MELYQIRSFVAAAEEKQLSRAAERLFLSQPAVSAHIKALENECGIALFTRTRKGVELTKEGALLLLQARKCLMEVNKFIHQAEGMRGDTTRIMNIGINTYPEVLRINEFLKSVSSDYPRFECRLFQSNSRAIPGVIKSGTLDAGFIYANVPPADCTFIQLRTTRLVVAGPAAWKKRLAKADWAALGGFPWIGVFDWCPFHNVMEDIFRGQGIKPNIVTTADGEGNLKNLVAGGVGLTLLTEEDALRAEKEGKAAVWKMEYFPLILYFVFSPERREDPVVDAAVHSIDKTWAKLHGKKNNERDCIHPGTR